MTQDTDSQDTQDELFPSENVPISNNHVLLPLPGAKYAPRTLTSKGQEHELTHFLEVYNHLCVHYKITSSREKCKGIIPYCTAKVTKMIEKLPSYNMGDYKHLVKDLYYFLDNTDDTYNSGKVESFTKKWRQRKIDSMELFKRYHRKYLELVGKAIGSQNMSDRDFNRYFWEGIHRSLRRRIEDRMLVANPDLDVSTPFEMKRVVKAVGYLFNRHRFDQHLLGKASYDSSASDSEDENYKPYKSRRPQSDSEDDKEDESNDTDHSRRSYPKKKRHPTDKKVSSKKDMPPKKESLPRKIEGEDISKLAQKMGQLSLSDPKYRAFYADIIREELEKQRPPPFTPPRPNPDNRFRRDPPPHPDMGPSRTYGQLPGPPPPRFDLHCFGCGKDGHRMTQCGELNTLINQRTIVRNEWGKLQWPDGSPIYKDREDSWVQAIGKVIKRANIVRAEFDDTDEREVYHYVGVAREEEDASSEEQEELGWLPGQVGDYYALGVERNPKVSKDTRKQVQVNAPGISQGMKNLPERRNAIGPSRQIPPINHGINSNRYQPGAPKRITPLDIHQGKFEPKRDNQFLPMDVDKSFIEKPGKDTKEIPTNQRRSEVVKITNPRTKSGRTSSEIVQDIMKMPLTITLEEAVNISPTVRRDLTYASKPQREVLPPGLEKNEKNALGANVSQSFLRKYAGRALGDPRDELLKVPATIGRAKIMAVFDSGSQINVLSDKWLKTCGLPVCTDGIERYRITGVNGGLARCVGRIPNAKIYVTDSELETIGELIVVEECGFDLLLGRPWATVNRAGLREAIEGTYLSFNSEGDAYEVNVAPNPNFEEKLRGIEVAACKARRVDNENTIYALAVGKQVSRSTVSESENEQGSRKSDDEDFDEYDKDSKLPALDWTKGDDDDEDDEPQDQTQARFAGEAGDDEERGWLSNPSRTQNNIESAHPLDDASIVIETELQDSYIKMVQKGASENEWKRFCDIERKSRKRDRDQWGAWKDKDQIDLPPGDPQPEETSPPHIPEPSATLATPESAQRPIPAVNRTPEDKRELVITAARRSQRVRRESQRARESEDWQRWKSKAYEREEKLTRKLVSRRPNEESSKTTSSFGAKLDLLEEKVSDWKGKLKSKSKKELMDNEPVLFMNGASRVTRRGPQDSPTRNEELWKEIEAEKYQQIVHGKTIEDAYLADETTADQAQEGTSSRVRETHSRRTYLYPTETPKDIEKMNKSHKPYNKRKEYSWVSKEEMKILREYIRNIPNNRGRRFFVFDIGINGVAVALIPETLVLNARTLKVWDSQRIVSIWRGLKGVLTRIPHHSINCAIRAQQQDNLSCVCPSVDAHIVINYPPVGPSKTHPNRSADKDWQIIDISNGCPDEFEEKTPYYQAYSCLGLRLDSETRPEEPAKSSIRKSTIDSKKVTQDLARLNLLKDEDERQKETSKKTSGRRSQDESQRLGSKEPKNRDQLYRHGRMFYIRRNAAVDDSMPAIEPAIKPFEESPAWDVVLGADGDHKTRSDQPLLGREEISAVLEWLDSLPENQNGGKHYLIYMNQSGEPTVTMTRDDRNAYSQQVGKTLMTLKKRMTYPADSYYGTPFFEGHIPTATKAGTAEVIPISRHPEEAWLREETNLWVSTPQTVPLILGSTRPNPIQISSCLIITADFKNWKEFQDEDAPQSANASASEDPPIIKTCLMVRTRPLNDLPKPKREEMEGNTNECSEDEESAEEESEEAKISREITMNFPIPDKTSFPPIPKERSNGVLGAYEVVPIAQYPGRDDHEFYAKGVTLAINDENEEVTYYRGNALIRIAGNDRLPKLRTPTRARVNHLRYRLFRMGAYSKEAQQDLTNVPRPCDKRSALDEDLRHLHQTSNTNPDKPSSDSTGEEMGSDELAAVVNELTKNPIQNPEEKQVYRITKHKDGRVVAARVLEGTPEWTFGFNKAESGNINNQPNTELEAETKEHKVLTKLGSDPQPSDQRPTESIEVRAIENREWDGPDWDLMTEFGPRSWWEPPDDGEINNIESLEGSKTIKQAEVAHQEEPLKNNPLPEKPPLTVNQIPNLSPNCLQPMNLKKEPTPLVLPSVASLAAMYSIDPLERQSVHRPTHAGLTSEETLHLPPVPNPPRPGVLGAAHFALLPEETSSDREPSFFAYGATVAYLNEKGQHCTYRGHALIYMYHLNTIQAFSLPPPPPRGKTEAARAYLFQHPSPFDGPHGDPRPYASHRASMLPPLASVRIDPRVPDFVPLNERKGRPLTNSPTQLVTVLEEGKEKQSAAETLISLKEEQARKNLPKANGIPIPIKDRTSVPSGEVSTKETDLIIGTDIPSDVAPTIKRIAFVSGGVLPGTVQPESKPDDVPCTPKDGVKTMELDKPPAEEQKDQVATNQESETHAISDNADIDMEYVKINVATPESPTKLVYPFDNDPSKSKKAESKSKSGSEAIVVDMPGEKPVQNTPEESQNRESEQDLPPSAFVQFATWKQSIVDLKKRIDDGSKWSDADAQQIFGDLGLLQWWYDIRQEEESGVEPNWKIWEKKIVEEWQKRYPEVPVKEFEDVARKLHELDEMEEDSLTVENLLDQKKREEDVEMDEDLPEKSSSRVAADPTQRRTPSANNATRYPPMPEVDEIAELKSRVSELEDRFTEMSKDMRDSLKSLGERVVEDQIVLEELRWRVGETRDLERRSGGGKRRYKKAKARLPSHRYPTRYSGDQAGEMAEMGRQAYGDLEGRIRKIEGRMERMKKEIERIEADLIRVDELAPKIDALTASFESFKSNQLKINLGIVQEIIKFKTLYSNTIEPKILDHSQELVLLTAKYNMLQAIAASLVASRTHATQIPKNTSPPIYPSYPIYSVNQARRFPAV